MSELLKHINTPADLKRLTVDELPELCTEIRTFLVNILSKHPGHLGSSLGTVELTVALHYVFSTPTDQIVWDVGHQAYTHKLLTGRKALLEHLREKDGAAPFPTPEESPHDAFIAGHASNSIAAALGIEVARKLRGATKEHTIAVIGDGAMTGGLAFEGLNNVSMTENDMLIVLNDNNMAIDHLNGGISQYLLELSTHHRYNKLRWTLYLIASKLHLINAEKKTRLLRLSNTLKANLSDQPNNLFSGLAIRYFGPTDGHNVLELVRIFEEIKDYHGPKVLHIVTKKGKGYAPAEKDPLTWHAPGRFNVETGQREEATQLTWAGAFGETLHNIMEHNQKVVAITPAMPAGSGMESIKQDFPTRFFDVGIAEGYAITFAAGLAKNGFIPYVCIYSTFIQRAYDNIIHDIAILNLPVVICIDRAGLVGQDGVTHQGLFDIAMLRPIPNIHIYAPRDKQQLENILLQAQTTTFPIAIRYPRGTIIENTNYIPPTTTTNGETAVISIGTMCTNVDEALKGTNIPHYNIQWIKPLPTELLKHIKTHYTQVHIFEEGMVHGGIGEEIATYLGTNCKTTCHGIDDFVTHATVSEQQQLTGLDVESIRDIIHDT